MAKKEFGWHFVADKLRDGSPIPADGVPLVYSGAIHICTSGLHFSSKPHQALRYAPGNTLCYVQVEDVRERQADKGVCSKRTIIKRINAKQLMRRFACDQALSVAHLREPNAVVDKYLQTADPALRDAARSAAWNAARYVASSAAWDAASSAAWDAASSAAWDAASSAAWDAAWDAARYAVWNAAWEEFDRRVYAAFGLN
jgi:hypothetical protein